jgi:3-oxoacyl-[acyl-carrier protein] reductase
MPDLLLNTEGFASLTGLRAVVTGSSTGIGRAIALEFARAGAAELVIHCRQSLDKAEAVAHECRRAG